jgi:hypothetical protein
MKKTLCKYIIHSALLLSVMLILFSCNKPGSDAVTNSFTWKYGNTNYTANFKAAYLHSLSVNSIIVGGTGASLVSLGIGPRITLSSLNVGTYNFNTSPNAIMYVDDQGNTPGVLSGTVNITANANSLLSGNFSATLSNNIILTGSFVNVPVEY